MADDREMLRRNVERTISLDPARSREHIEHADARGAWLDPGARTDHQEMHGAAHRAERDLALLIGALRERRDLVPERMSGRRCVADAVVRIARKVGVVLER